MSAQDREFQQGSFNAAGRIAQGFTQAMLPLLPEPQRDADVVQAVLHASAHYVARLFLPVLHRIKGENEPLQFTVETYGNEVLINIERLDVPGAGIPGQALGTQLALSKVLQDVFFEEGTIHGLVRIAPGWAELIRLGQRVVNANAGGREAGLQELSYALVPLVHGIMTSLYARVVQNTARVNVEVARALADWMRAGRPGGDPEPVIRDAMRALQDGADGVAFGYRQDSGDLWFTEKDAEFTVPEHGQRGDA